MVRGMLTHEADATVVVRRACMTVLRRNRKRNQPELRLRLLQLKLLSTMQPAICVIQGFAVTVTNVSTVLVCKASSVAYL